MLVSLKEVKNYSFWAIYGLILFSNDKVKMFLYPFGQELKNVEQKDKTPNKVFLYWVFMPALCTPVELTQMERRRLPHLP